MKRESKCCTLKISYAVEEGKVGETEEQNT
jgi:hypothetical protein